MIDNTVMSVLSALGAWLLILIGLGIVGQALHYLRISFPPEYGQQVNATLEGLRAELAQQREAAAQTPELSDDIVTAALSALVPVIEAGFERLLEGHSVTVDVPGAADTVTVPDDPAVQTASNYAILTSDELSTDTNDS